MEPTRHHQAHRQTGATAVELALILPILVTLLTAPFFLTVFMWHYTAVTKAAQDAARYISTISEQEMREQPLAEEAARIATLIAETETAELVGTPRVRVFCGTNRLCSDGIQSGTLPDFVSVQVELDLKDTFFKAVNTGRYGWKVRSEAQMAYVGR